MIEQERIPTRYRDEVLRRIGHGGEATVYELTGGRVLRVFHGAAHGASKIAAFYRSIAAANVSFALPEILDQGEEAGVAYSLDRLIPGRPLHELMPRLEGAERTRALANYTDAAFEIASLPCPAGPYGEFLRDDDSIRAPTWNAYLLARMRRSLEAAPWLGEDVPGLAGIVSALTERVEGMAPAPPALAHGDYFPGNVLMAGDLTVSGVIDFGPLTVIGDRMLDLASAVIFLEVTRPGYRPSDTDFVRERLATREGAAVSEAVTTYRGWYAIRFSPYRGDDANLYAWCVASLRGLRDELPG